MYPSKPLFALNVPFAQHPRGQCRPGVDQSDPDRPDYDHLATNNTTPNSAPTRTAREPTPEQIRPSDTNSSIRAATRTGIGLEMYPPWPHHTSQQQHQSTLLTQRETLGFRNIDDFSSKGSSPYCRRRERDHDRDQDQDTLIFQDVYASRHYGSIGRPDQGLQWSASSQRNNSQQPQSLMPSASIAAGHGPHLQGFSIQRDLGYCHREAGGPGKTGKGRSQGPDEDVESLSREQVPPSRSRITSSENWTHGHQSQYFAGSQQQYQDTTGVPPSEEIFAQEIILAINIRGRTVGCAYYDGQVSKLFVMNDMRDCNVPEMIEIVNAQLRPSLILTSSRMDESVLGILRFGGDGTGEEVKIEVRPANDFSYPLAKSRLVSVLVHIHRTSRTVSRASASFEGGGPESVDIPIHCSGMEETTQREAQLHLSNLIDLQSTESIGSAGAVVSFLSRHGLSYRNIRSGRPVMIISIASFSIDSFMFVNANTLSSLQVFEDESHPNMHNGFRGRKEGFSLFGILSQTKTSQGRYLLKQWLLRPSLDLRVIHTRHQTVECLTRTVNQPTVVQLQECLSHIKNIPKVLQALPRKATLAEWQAILQFVFYCLKIYGISQEILVGEPPIMQQILVGMSIRDLNDVGTFINDVVDFDESVNEGRCVVKHKVDEELDGMRQNYHGLDSFLSEIAKEISGTIPFAFTKTINVIYFPQLGYLITVPMNPEWKTETDFTLEGLQYQFSTETTVYYKNNSMRELDEHLGDIHGLIVDREIDILQGLQERVLEYSQFLVTCSDLCAELDVLVSFSQVARVHSYKRPTMTEENVLQILKGRHPLQELVVNSFVANDTSLGDINGAFTSDIAASEVAPHSETTAGESGPRDARTDVAMDTATDLSSSRDAHTVPSSNDLLRNSGVMILTGANSSGKSVYLKQVALITYMAHVGSFVPAESALIGLTDKILTRLQTRETVSCLQSAFMTDLHQVAVALRLATRRSLVILDEFGKGTTPADGAGMFSGVMEHFAKMQQGRPKVVGTTHFHELLENRLLDLRLPISLYTMEVYQEPSGLEATFLFRVIPGKTPSSLGPACAAMASMPSHVVKRGINLSNIFRRYENVVPQLTEYDEQLQQMYEKLTKTLMNLHLDISKLGEHGGETLPDREDFKDPLLLLSEDSNDDNTGSEQETGFCTLRLEEEETDQGSESVLASSGMITSAGVAASTDGCTVNAKKRKDPPSESPADDGVGQKQRSLARMLRGMVDLLEYATKVSEKEQEELLEDEDQDDDFA